MYITGETNRLIRQNSNLKHKILNLPIRLMNLNADNEISFNDYFL